jgi:hypothetical protein
MRSPSVTFFRGEYFPSRMPTKRPKLRHESRSVTQRRRKTPLLKPKIQVVRLPFKVVEVEKLPECDSTVGGINKFAAEDPKYAIPYPYKPHVLLIDSRLKAESKEKTIKHEKAEATIMATLRNLKRRGINHIDYDSAHLLTNRLDFIYGNTFSSKKKRGKEVTVRTQGLHTRRKPPQTRNT